MADEAELNMWHLGTITPDSPLAATFVDFVSFFQHCLGHPDVKYGHRLHTLLAPFYERPSPVAVQYESPLTLMRLVLEVSRPFARHGRLPPVLPDLAAVLRLPPPAPPCPPAGQQVVPGHVVVTGKAGQVLGPRVGGLAAAVAIGVLGSAAGFGASEVHSSGGGTGASARLQGAQPPPLHAGDLVDAAWSDPDSCILPNLADIPSSYGTSSFSSDCEDDSATAPSAVLYGFEPAPPPVPWPPGPPSLPVGGAVGHS